MPLGLKKTHASAGELLELVAIFVIFRWADSCRLSSNGEAARQERALGRKSGAGSNPAMEIPILRHHLSIDICRATQLTVCSAQNHTRGVCATVASLHG
jgi:hypothetical protein